MHSGSDIQPGFAARATGADWIEIPVRGKPSRVPSARIDGQTIIATGRWLKIAAVRGEEFVEGQTVRDPEAFVSRLKETGLKADLFTFVQKLPDIVPKYRYHLEWDNAAVIPITTFSDWLNKRVEYDVRKAVKKAARVGVVVKLAAFDDTFVQGISGIYNETPIRQGKPFWHYQKDLESVRRENSTYPDRSAYIGAYYDNELIGFIRMVYVDKIAATLQVISKKQHSDKKPTSALIAKAVEICEQRGVSHLMYGQYIYNDPASSLTEFKRRNGFEQFLLPRYYIPLTLKGKIALKLGLHRGIAGMLPPKAIAALLRARARFQRSENS
jgi:hypothetical protein